MCGAVHNGLDSTEAVVDGVMWCGCQPVTVRACSCSTSAAASHNQCVLLWFACCSVYTSVQQTVWELEYWPVVALPVQYTMHYYSKWRVRNQKFISEEEARGRGGVFSSIRSVPLLTFISLLSFLPSFPISGSFPHLEVASQISYGIWGSAVSSLPSGVERHLQSADMFPPLIEHTKNAFAVEPWWQVHFWCI